jgi:hypothetical protein
MRHLNMALMILAVLLTASCQDATAPVGQLESGKLIVRVVWDGQGVPDKRVEVLELDLTGTTDAAGYATFELPQGDYTLRAYDINRGGPAQHIDTTVTIEARHAVRIEIQDCVPCV